MKYKKVPKIDLNFSAIGYGCWGASGEKYWSGHSDRDQIEAIHTAIESGINMFDVAPVYGLGHAEEILGKAIKGNRDKVIVATKCGLLWNENGNIINNLKKDSILKEIDDSLKRLSLDYVDLYQVHWPSNSGVPIEETMEALNIIKREGKARYIGLSNFSASQAEEAMKYCEICSMQGLYNMIERNSETYHGISLPYRTEKEILPFVKKQGMAFLPYSPLFQGLLAGSFDKNKKLAGGDVRNENPKLSGESLLEYLDLVEKIKVLTKDIGHPINEVALNWLIAQDEVTSVIQGARNAAHVESNIKSLEWELPVELITEINNLVDSYNK